MSDTRQAVEAEVELWAAINAYGAGCFEEGNRGPTPRLRKAVAALANGRRRARTEALEEAALIVDAEAAHLRATQDRTDISHAGRLNCGLKAVELEGAATDIRALSGRPTQEGA